MHENVVSLDKIPEYRKQVRFHHQHGDNISFRIHQGAGKIGPLGFRGNAPGVEQAAFSCHGFLEIGAEGVVFPLEKGVRRGEGLSSVIHQKNDVRTDSAVEKPKANIQRRRSFGNCRNEAGVRSYRFSQNGSGVFEKKKLVFQYFQGAVRFTKNFFVVALLHAENAKTSEKGKESVQKEAAR